MVAYLRPRLLLTDAGHLGQAVEIARELDIALVVTGTTITVTPGIDLDAETARGVRRHARATRTDG